LSVATAASETGRFEAAAAELAQRHADSWTQPIRDRGLARFLALGIPTTRLEDWKSTSVAALAKIPFQAASGAPSASAAEGWLPRAPGPRLVLVNGQCVPDVSRALSGEDGRRVRGLGCVLAEERDLVEPHLDRLVTDEGAAFAALNAALLEDGAFIRIPRGVVIEEPIHVLNVASPRGESLSIQPRTLIVLEAGARATVVETHVGHEGESLINAVTEIRVGEGASLVHVQIQRQAGTAFHLGTTAARVEREGSFTSTSITLGARLSRQQLDVTLAGEGATCRLDGLVFLSGGQHADHHVFVDHVAPRCTSRQLYKYACAGRSRGVFRGRVRVGKDAQGTSAHQTNRNLLLSDDALVDTKPQLEISADDVRCTHGATIGQLDPEQLFYLRTRGIGEAAARHLLVKAFADEMVDRIEVPEVREALHLALDARQAEIEAAVSTVRGDS
jgi:Fe-S cluster assembly protein SufD